MILQIVWPNTFPSEARISFVLQCNCTVSNMEAITVQSVHFRMDNLFFRLDLPQSRERGGHRGLTAGPTLDYSIEQGPPEDKT